jgi:ElaB/YqjD/DUF883 family membrane-anchored ribosome-binding protein
MHSPVRHLASSLVIAAMLATSAPSAAQRARTDQPRAQPEQQVAQSTASANAASARATQALVDANAAKAPPPPPADETPQQAKARKKAERAAAAAAERQQRAAAADAERQRRAADRAAHPERGRAARNCAVGAVVGILGSLLLGGRSAGSIIGAGVGGCIVGWGLGEALKGEDEKKLNGYLTDDYVERDDVATTRWHAPESGQDLDVQTVSESYKPVQHTVTVSPDMAFDPNNIQVSVRKMRTTAALSLRSTTDATSRANVVGSFGANEIVQVYGETNDHKWSYLADRATDGTYQLIGYVPTANLSASLSIPSGPIRVAKPKPKPAPVQRAAARGRKGAPARVAPVPMASAAPAAAPQRVTFSAATRCKNVRVSAMGKSGARELCGGSNNVA